MKPDPQTPIEPAGAQWVQGELVRSLMRIQRNTQFLGLVLIPAFLGVLWADAPPLAQAAWAIATAWATGATLRALAP